MHFPDCRQTDFSNVCFRLCFSSAKISFCSHLRVLALAISPTFIYLHLDFCVMVPFLLFETQHNFKLYYKIFYWLNIYIYICKCVYRLIKYIPVGSLLDLPLGTIRSSEGLDLNWYLRSSYPSSLMARSISLSLANPVSLSACLQRS